MLMWELLQEGGTRVLSLGLFGVLCTVWGIYQFRHPPGKGNRILHLLCSTTPALWGLWIFARMCTSYARIARSTIAPTREEFDLVISQVIVIGSLFLLCTLIPLVLAATGLIRNNSSREFAHR